MAATIQRDVERVQSLEVVPTILDTLCRLTGMGFAAIARVTEDRWVACGVQDLIEFGLQPGGELKVETTICHEIRDRGEPVVIDNVDDDPAYANHHTPAMYGIKSYISMPIILPDGRFFGTICAIDPRPAHVSRPEVVNTFKLFASLVAFHLDAQERFERSEALLVDERAVATDAKKERDRLFEMSRDLFGVATFEGYLQSVNPAWSRYLDRSEDELTTRPFAEIIHPDDLAVTGEVVAALQRGEPVHQFLVRLLKADGTPVSFAWSAVPDAGKTSGIFYTVGRDITEEQQREEMLRQSQKMEAIGQLTGGLAHDFNNLLAGISGSLELIQIRMRQGRQGDVDRYIGAAQDAAGRAAALTHRLLAFSRRQTLAPKPTEVKQLVAGMQELISRTVGPSITVESINAGGLWPSLIDPSQLENTILNLCINARDAMPDGGKITVETANRWLDRHAAEERGVEPGQYVAVCVSDTGTGMPPEVIAKAFDPFFTTKPIGMGTGLGLSMIYGFARQSGGTVTIYSEVGQGATVCVYLPRYVGELERPHDAADATDIPRAEAGETVLVIDDEPTVRMLVGEVLSDLGYTAIEAKDGAGGLKVLHSDARIDLLITDVGLPGGMNGRQVADAARMVRPDLKVLFITGYAENAVLSHGHLDPGMHVITKPFPIDLLATRIRELISR